MIRLIIADDEKDTRDAVIGLIPWNQYGFEIAGVADDGLGALDVILREKPDVALLDIRMPGIDGLEVIRRAREQMEAPPVFVIISGYDEFNYAQQALHLRAHSYLLKPFMPEELVDRLRDAAAEHAAIMSALSMKRATPQSRLQALLSSELSRSGPIQYPADGEREIVRHLITIDRGGLQRALDAFLTELYLNHPDPSIFFHCGLMLYAEVMRVLAQRGCSLLSDHFTPRDWDGGDPVANTMALLRCACEEALNILKECTSSVQIVNRAVDYIQAHYAEKFSLQAIAGEVHVSPVYLSNLFSKTMSMTLTEYLQKVRIEAASRMLRECDDSLSAIAEKTGYLDAKYFAQIFKRVTGVSPAAYRARLPRGR